MKRRPFAFRKLGSTSWKLWGIELVPIVIIIISRFLALPEGIIDLDEANYALGVVELDVAKRQPHPPGNPGIVFLGKALYPIVGDPLLSVRLVNLALSVAAYFALVALLCTWFTRWNAIGFALLFSFIPGVWVFSASGLTTSAATSMMLVAAALLFTGERDRTILIGWVMLGLAAATRPIFGHAIVLLGLAELWKRRRSLRLSLLSCFIAVVLAASAMVVTIAVTGTDPYLKHLEAHTNYNINQNISGQVAKIDWSDHAAIDGIGGALPATLWTLFFVIGLVAWGRKKPAQAAFLGLLACSIGVLLLFTTVPTLGRYHSVLYAAMLPAVAHGVAAVVPERNRLVPTLTCTIFFAAMVASQIWQWHNTGSAWTRAAVRTRTLAQEDNVGIIVEARLLRRVAKLYLHDMDAPVLLMKKNAQEGAPEPLYNKSEIGNVSQWYYLTSNPDRLSNNTHEIFDGPEGAQLLKYDDFHAEIRSNPVVPVSGVLRPRESRREWWIPLKEEFILYTFPGAEQLTLNVAARWKKYCSLVVTSEGKELHQQLLHRGSQEVVIRLPGCHFGCMVEFRLGENTLRNGCESKNMRIYKITAGTRENVL